MKKQKGRGGQVRQRHNGGGKPIRMGGRLKQRREIEAFGAAGSGGGPVKGRGKKKGPNRKTSETSQV